jgi:CubicO group peptidase (beta-lactamase class C family)
VKITARTMLLLSTLAGSGCAGPSTMNDTAAAPSRLSADTTPQAHADVVRALAQPFVDGHWTPALAIGLVSPTGVETYGLGRVRDDGSPTVPDADTAFEIGSVSKVFTSLILADAVHRGDLALEEPIDELLPPGVHAPSMAGRQITLQHLATHTSGLPSLPANFAPASDANPYADYTRDLLFAALPATTLATAPGTTYAYSNLGAGLLGQLLSDHAHATYAELLRSRITQPLGMTRTDVVFPAANVAQSHDAGDDAVPPWDFAALAGAGAVRSTVRDLVELVRANLAPPSGDLGAAIELTQRPQTAPPIRPMGLAWHVGLGPASLASVLWHNGQTAGAHAFVALDLTGKNGVVVLANAGQMRVDDLGIALLQTLRGEATAPIDLPVTVPVAESTLATYVGKYVVSDDFALDISRQGPQLFVQATHQPRFHLYARSEAEFYLRDVDAAITFRSDALVLHQGGQDTVAKRVTADR